MHIVAMAWLYIIALMGLALSNRVLGLVFLLFVGVAPVALARLLVMLRKRLHRSMVEQQVNATDDPDAKPDQ